MPQPNIQSVLSTAQATLTESGVSSARLDSELLLAHVLGQPRTWLHAHSEESITPTQLKNFDSLIKQRAGRIPLVHLTGSRQFYGLELKVTKDVLTPRVETEKMVEFAIKHARKGGKLIDVGTGSGAIAIAIKKHRPDLDVTATDLSDTQLLVARSNANNLQTNITFVASDLWNNVHGRFDVIATNLPYLKDDADLMPEVTKEPSIALFGGHDGLSIYQRFLFGINDHLKPGGLLFTECDPWQQPELIKLANAHNLTVFVEDYFILGFRLGSPS